MFQNKTVLKALEKIELHSVHCELLGQLFVKGVGHAKQLCA